MDAPPYAVWKEDGSATRLGARLRWMMSAAFSAMASVDGAVCPPGRMGMTDESHTRTPYARRGGHGGRDAAGPRARGQLDRRARPRGRTHEPARSLRARARAHLQAHHLELVIHDGHRVGRLAHLARADDCVCRVHGGAHVVLQRRVGRGGSPRVLLLLLVRKERWLLEDLPRLAQPAHQRLDVARVAQVAALRAARGGGARCV